MLARLILVNNLAYLKLMECYMSIIYQLRKKLVPLHSNSLLFFTHIAGKDLIFKENSMAN